MPSGPNYPDNWRWNEAGKGGGERGKPQLQGFLWHPEWVQHSSSWRHFICGITMSLQAALMEKANAVAFSWAQPQIVKCPFKETPNPATLHQPHLPRWRSCSVFHTHQAIYEPRLRCQRLKSLLLFYFNKIKIKGARTSFRVQIYP